MNENKICEIIKMPFKKLEFPIFLYLLSFKTKRDIWSILYK